MKKILYAVIIIAIILLAVYIVKYRSDKDDVVGTPITSNLEVNLATTSDVSVKDTTVTAPSTDIKNNSTKNMDTEKVSKAGDTLTVNYVGTLENGTKFDSSIDRGTPFKFVVGIGQVIKGWDEGMVGMKVGEKKRLVIPGEKAYGSRGIPDGNGGYMIPPNATLIFEVEMLGIESK
ncbi:MAG: FKBP-type peptidyl-prolyl cis-trans isomerase [bacterium]